MWLGLNAEAEKGRGPRKMKEPETLGEKEAPKAPPHPVTSTTFISAFPRRDSVKDTGVQACLALAMG